MLAKQLMNQQWAVITVAVVMIAVEVAALNGPNVCMVQQKYNITKRVKYRAPMSVRTYEWCFAMPPRCSRWSTEMRDLTRLENEERIAEVAVCCPGYKIRDVSCVPECPFGKTGPGCTQDCPPNKWGPNCVYACERCNHGDCSPVTGECQCHNGWQGESCERSMPPITTSTTSMKPLTTLTTITETLPQTVATTIITTPRISAMTISTTPRISTTTIIAVPKVPTTTTTSIQLTSELNPFTTTSKNIPITTPSSQKTSNERIISASDEYSAFINWSSTTKLEERISTTTEKGRYETTEPYSTTILNAEKSLNLPKTTPLVQKTSSNTEINITKSHLTTTSIKGTTQLFGTTTKPESSIKIYQTTSKLRPKEIWIKPSQKGESSIIESKLQSNHEISYFKYKNFTKKELLMTTSTPRTIVVSIIPTSLTYSTFRKIALSTTASHISSRVHPKNNVKKTTASVPSTASSPLTTKLISNPYKMAHYPSTAITLLQNVTKSKIISSLSTKEWHATTPETESSTNSMSSTSNVVSSSSYKLTSVTLSTNITRNESKIATEGIISYKPIATTSFTKVRTTIINTTEQSVSPFMLHKKETPTKETYVPMVSKSHEKKSTEKTNVKRNVTNIPYVTSTVTSLPETEETFHILTEPEHITAVMGEKESERSSVNLISVISIAGGVMMAVITVAVIIVMIDRCRKPTYEEVRKMNDINMQVMINDRDLPPPPYARSIFHTPLPDPPTSEKCHYQPISTLDRNLKQFMRPVVVQTISPIMLENFRDILECHYDHLPRRSQVESCCSVSPSVSERTELLQARISSIEDATIEVLKCEAKFEVIDNTTSEPLYAEIPAWRPPSEHAIEVENCNGEAVTEL